MREKKNSPDRHDNMKVNKTIKVSEILMES